MDTITVDAQRIDQLVRAFARAALKDYRYRVPLGSTPDEFFEVEVGLNMLFEALDAAHRENLAHVDEIERQARTISDRQNEALRALATPIILVSPRILALPVIGAVDTERSATMMDALLARVMEEQAEHVIVDITGVGVLDTRTADHFIRMAKAVRMLGAECYLTGVSPAIAQTMAELGIELSSVRTLRSVGHALSAAQKAMAAES